jgi:serine protease Do
VRLTIRHLTGARATRVDVVTLGPHREVILGRAPSAAVRFDPRRDAGVGRHHARIEQVPDDPLRFRLVDLESRNGTWLNGARLTGPALLRPGDVIRLGQGGPEVRFGVEGVNGLAATGGDPGLGGPTMW